MANKKLNQLVTKPSIASGDLFPIADATTGQLYKTTISDLGTAIGSGVSSVNGLVGAVVLDTDDIQELASPVNKWFTDLRARAAISVSSPLAYNSGTGLITITQATGSANGYLSSTDWTTFNSKQAALSGTGFVKISGTTISYDNSTYLTTSSAASTYLPLTGGTLTGALQVNGYLSAQVGGAFYGDVVLSGTNPRLYFTDTDNNPDYFISNTDGTFTVYDATNSTARFTIGTTGNANFSNAITGGGSITGQSLYSNGIISAGTSLSVGTFVSAGGSLTGSALYVTGMTAGNGAIYHTGSRLTFANYNASGTLHFEVNGGVGALTINADKSATFEAGGSFAGSLTGTSASFNSTLTTTGGTRSIQLVSYSADYNYLRSNGAPLVFGTQDSQDLYIKTNDTTRLTLVGSSGAATFSSSVTANSTSGVSGTFTSSTFFGSIDLENTGGTATGKWNVQAVSGAQIGGSAGSSFGIYSYGASAYRMFINSSGNVGIGTTSPTEKLSLFGSTSTTFGLSLEPSGWNGAKHRFSVPVSGDTSMLSFNYNGSSVDSSSYGTSAINVSSGVLYFSTGTTNTAPSERMRITSGGEILIGTTTNVDKMTINGGIRSIGSSSGFFWENRSSSANFYGWYTTSGTIYLYNNPNNIASINASTGIYMALSDKNKKKDFEVSNIGLAEVMQLKPTLFRMKTDSNNDAKHLGFIAQEVKDLIPQAYTETSEGFIGLQDRPIIAALTKAIQEQQVQIQELKEQLANK